MKATANQLRLFLHAGAYWLMWGLRVSMPRRSVWRLAQFDTLRLRLIKIAARVVEMKTMIRLYLPTACSCPGYSASRARAYPTPDHLKSGAPCPQSQTLSRQPANLQHPALRLCAGDNPARPESPANRKRHPTRAPCSVLWSKRCIMRARNVRLCGDEEAAGKAVIDLIYGGAVRAAMLIEAQTYADRERIHADILDAVRLRHTPDGRYLLRRPAVLAQGRKPTA